MPICCVILNYFDETGTVACIKSLESEPLDLIIVVDNSGERKAAGRLSEKVNEYIETKSVSNIRLIINDENLGFSRGVNRAISTIEEEASFEYYFLINNDALATGGLINKLRAEFDADKNLSVVSPAIKHRNINQGYLYYQPVTGLMFGNHILGAFGYLSGCCMLIKRSDFSAGIFDEDFFMYGEDVELSWRLKEQGKKIKLCGDVSVVHEGSVSSKRCSLFYEYHTLRGHFLLSGKVSKLGYRPLAHTVKPVVMMFRMFIRVIRCRSIAPLEAFFYVVKGETPRV